MNSVKPVEEFAQHEGVAVPRALIEPTQKVTLPRPQPAVEQRYRLIALRLEASLDGRAHARGGRLVVVTSPQARDGRTMSALELGVGLSLGLGRSVALVDADPGKGGLPDQLGLIHPAGLAEVTRGDCLLPEALWGTAEGLHILPAGAGVAGARCRVVLSALRDAYDYVLVDAPSLDRSAEAAMLGRSADGVVLVVRSGATKRAALANALDALHGVSLLGTILCDYNGPFNSGAHHPAALVIDGEGG